VWHLLADSECRRAVELSEQAADVPDMLSQANEAGSRVWDAARRRFGLIFEADRLHSAYMAAAYTCATEVGHADQVIGHSINLASRSGFPTALSNLLRCIAGNPFRPVVCEPPWRTSAVVGLAEGIYADRAFDRLPILADALEEAGCDSADILAHCRGGGPHARGCWVVDLVLGKV
jgi:hypothetical protein